MFTAPAATHKNPSTEFYKSETYPDPVRLVHLGCWAKTSLTPQQPCRMFGLHEARHEGFTPLLGGGTPGQPRQRVSQPPLPEEREPAAVAARPRDRPRHAPAPRASVRAAEGPRRRRPLHCAEAGERRDGPGTGSPRSRSEPPWAGTLEAAARRSTSG